MALFLLPAYIDFVGCPVLFEHEVGNSEPRHNSKGNILSDASVSFYAAARVVMMQPGETHPEHLLPAQHSAAQAALQLWQNTWNDTIQQMAVMADCLQVRMHVNNAISAAVCADSLILL